MLTPNVHQRFPQIVPNVFQTHSNIMPDVFQTHSKTIPALSHNVEVTGQVKEEGAIEDMSVHAYIHPGRQ